MKPMVMLDNKEVRTIIAKYLGINEEEVVPNRYNFSVVGLTEKQIEDKLKNG